VRNMNFAYKAYLFHARKENLRHGTDGFSSPPKVVLRIFFILKNQSSSAGFEPANLGSSGKHATTRPRRATIFIMHLKYYWNRKAIYQI
jgi:hypothetical protein